MIQQNISLKPFNTFGVEASAKYYAEFNGRNQLYELVFNKELRKEKVLILGGGSNILLTKDFDGLVLRNTIPGFHIVDENDNHVIVRAGGGVVWHDLVMWSVNMGLGGLENLSLIPGSVGAAPMQNIGAYGVELKDTFHSLEAMHRKSGDLMRFSNSDCEFAYRSSIFKTREKDNFVITSVEFKLSKNPTFNVSYGSIQEELDKMDVSTLSVKAVSDAVIRIRQSKLPDPKQIGNAGSFFKNPTVSTETFESIKKKYPEVVGYPQGEEGVKLAAGWLIEKAGWKGKRFGNYGIHEKQALVLVNYGGAKGAEIDALSNQIQMDILAKFGVELEKEVNRV